jgi:hypothetical protein
VEERGRKPKGNYKQMTRVLSTRITADTRAALEQAAEKSGHSLSQEIEHRLRRSFDVDKQILGLFGNRKNYAVLRLISCVMETVHDRERPEATWIDDPVLFGQLLSAIVTILQELGPPLLPADQQPEGTTRAGSPVRGEHYRGEINGYLRGSIQLNKVREAGNQLPLPPDSADPAPFIRDDLAEFEGARSRNDERGRRAAPRVRLIIDDRR